MTEPKINYLGDVQRLELKPGDTVVITPDRPIPAEQMEHIIESIGEWLPDHKVIVLGDGFKIGVLAS